MTPCIPFPNAAPAALPRIRHRGRYPHNVTSIALVKNARRRDQWAQAAHDADVATAQENVRRCRQALAQWEAHLYNLQTKRSVNHG